ncbi:MAG: hypothetical protein IJ527_03745 [Prevotella sp.]|nr:hypothetical protein [Prevotella sp.]
MKKQYINPTMDVVKVNMSNSLLAVSGGGLESGSGTPGDEYTSTDESFARGGDFDDWDD